jgi:hypothetical protein
MNTKALPQRDVTAFSSKEHESAFTARRTAFSSNLEILFSSDMCGFAVERFQSTDGSIFKDLHRKKKSVVDQGWICEQRW